MAVGVTAGDEVIIPDFTMAACAFAVTYCGAVPVFVDCDDSLCIDAKLIESKITPRTKAIMPVHIYGRLCNMDAIMQIANRHNLYVIEDAAEAQGACTDSVADITCYSFYENKIIHAEEGGICTTDNSLFAARMNFLKNMAFGDRHDYFHTEVGYNYRMPNAQAKLALKSLKDYPSELKRRRKIEKKFYGANLPKYIHAAPWVLDYILDSVNFSFVMPPNTRPFFKPISSFPMYGGKCQSPKAKYYSERGFYLKII